MKDYAIETVELTKQYGYQKAVNNLDMHVEYGKIYGLLGRNGAGKTTTMRMMLNLIHITNGEIRLFGDDYRKNPLRTYRRIGSIIETPGFYENLTGKENLKILARLRGQHRYDSVDRALEIMRL
jgi:ABC-type multidrug transport system ATPase subunit